MNMFETIIVRRAPGFLAHHGLLQAGSHTLECALGRSGTTVFKREGDWATPAQCVMRAQTVFFNRQRVSAPKTQLPIKSVGQFDGWCDAPSHPAYNMPVRLPFKASHETMLRDDCLYDVGVVLDFNRPPSGRKRFGGSAIFMHCATPGFQPTAGCIALRETDLRWLLAHVDRHTRIVVLR